MDRSQKALQSDLAAALKNNADLEKEVADLEEELATLRASKDAEMATLRAALRSSKEANRTLGAELAAAQAAVPAAPGSAQGCELASSTQSASQRSASGVLRFDKAALSCAAAKWRQLTLRPRPCSQLTLRLLVLP